MVACRCRIRTERRWIAREGAAWPSTGLPGHCKHHNGGWSVTAYSPGLRELPIAAYRLLYSADDPTRASAGCLLRVVTVGEGRRNVKKLGAARTFVESGADDTDDTLARSDSGPRSPQEQRPSFVVNKCWSGTREEVVMVWLTEAEFDYWMDIYEGKYDKKPEEVRKLQVVRSTPQHDASPIKERGGTRAPHVRRPPTLRPGDIIRELAELDRRIAASPLGKAFVAMLKR